MVPVKRLPGGPLRATRREVEQRYQIRQLSSSLNVGRTAKGNTQREANARAVSGICQRRGLCHGQRVGVHDRAVFRYRLGDHGAGTWQLVINTATTIITFLMVFLIQATQNRDSKAIQLNLDELLRAITKARTGLVGLEHLPESEIQELEAEFATLKGDVADELSTAQRYPIPENAGANRDE